MSQEQKKLRLLISSSVDLSKIKDLKHQRNKLLKQITTKILKNLENEIDE